MNLHQLCPPTHSLQARSSLHLGFSKNTGAFNTSSSEDIWDMQILTKGGSKSGWMLILWGLVNLVKFLEVTSLTPSLEWRSSCPYQHAQNRLHFVVVPNCLQILLKLISAVTCTLAHLEWAPLWQCWRLSLNFHIAGTLVGDLREFFSIETSVASCLTPWSYNDGLKVSIGFWYKNLP